MSGPVCVRCGERDAHIAESGRVRWCKPCSIAYKLERREAAQLTPEEITERRRDAARRGAETRWGAQRRERDAEEPKADDPPSSESYSDSLVVGGMTVPLSRGGALELVTPQETARTIRYAALRETNDLHVIESVHFKRSPSDVRYLECTCSWTTSDAPTDEAQQSAFNSHRREVGAMRGSGPVERVRSESTQPDDDADVDEDAA